MAYLGSLILWGCPRRARSGNTSLVFVDDSKDHKPIMCETVLREDACECVNYFLDLSSRTCPHFQITKKGILALCSLRGCQGPSQENVTGISLFARQLIERNQTHLNKFFYSYCGLNTEQKSTLSQHLVCSADNRSLELISPAFIPQFLTPTVPLWWLTWICLWHWHHARCSSVMSSLIFSIMSASFTQVIACCIS